MTRINVFSNIRLLWEKHQDELKPVLILAAAFFVGVLTVALHRYFTFYASYDQGIFAQLFWNGIHGRFFQSSLSSGLSGAVVHDGQVPTVFYHRLGQHFDPIQLIWHPFFALFPNAATLVMLQTAYVTVAGLVLYTLARHYLKPSLSWMIVAGFYGSVAVIGPTLSNYHDLSQIPLFLFTLFLAFEKRWWWLFWLMAVFTVLARQDAGVTLFGVGLYLILSRRHPWAGVGLCSLGFGYVIVASNVFMPMFSKDVSQRFMIERFGHFANGNEASSLEILWGILTNPGRLLRHLLSAPDQKIFYLFGQTLSLVFVPLISPSAWVLISPPLAQLFLQGGQSRFSIYIRYAITLAPGLFYGAILWWSVHQDRFRLRFRKIWTGFIILSLLIMLLKNPHRAFYFVVPDSFQPWVYVPLMRQWEHAAQVRSLIQQVPPNASVSATTYIIPHMATRRAILRVPFLQYRDDDQQVKEVDYILMDLWQLNQYQPAFREERGYLRDLLSQTEYWMTQKNYGIQAITDGVILMQRGVSSKPELLKTWEELRQTYQSTLKPQ
ncbi:putative membrane protein [Leptolyngbyaceae cyanobacterium JSC-12]|nr:putative membrane protein [Leptolyngbyaceae cyanobacterium JSC-12]